MDNTSTFSNTLDSDAIDATVLPNGAATYNYGANGNSLISENRGGASKYYHSDALGSTGALTNSSGTTTDTHVTDAFGMSITGSGSTPTPFGFVGQGGYQSDNDTGLILCGHRYYDSSTGRFLSRDPALSGENWYVYCAGDPINNLDPTGEVGAGVIAGGSIGAGLGPNFSLGSNVSGGIGYFTDQPVGLFGSAGSYFDPPSGGVSSPPGGGGSAGVYAGLGGGLFVTNANTAQELAVTKATSEFDINLDWCGIGLSFSVALSYENPIETWTQKGLGVVQLSVTGGPAVGYLLISHLVTSTIASSGGQAVKRVQKEVVNPSLQAIFGYLKSLL